MAHPSEHKERKFYNASQESGYVQALLEQGVPYATALKLDEERLANGGKIPEKKVIEQPKKIEKKVTKDEN